MLYEIKNVKQYEGEQRRRWFFDQEIDLTVWFDEKNEIKAFQLCYDKIQSHHALTWRKDIGYQHHQVDDGENNDRIGCYKGIPILLMGGQFDKQRIIDLFVQKSQDIPKQIFEFVLEKIISY